MISPRTRLAPSPTGTLHLGNARTFLVNWLAARKAGGAVVLRIEDIDRGRCRREYVERCLDDLRWLGLTWDEGPTFQSERLALYEHAFARLAERGKPNTGTTNRESDFLTICFPLVFSGHAVAGAAAKHRQQDES